MKQQDAYKLLAAFMILVMIIVPVAYVITSPRDNAAQEDQQSETQQEKYNPELWTVDRPLYSISDALNMTPYGSANAEFVDVDSMTPQMTQWAKQTKIDLVDYPVVSWMDSVYKSNTTKVYYSHLQEGKNESFLLLSDMSPQRNDFQYMVIPDVYPPVLRRLEPGLNGLYNVMGTPVILAPEDTVAGVLNIISDQNKTRTSYDQYQGILSRVGPAPFQNVSSNVSFAKQFYMGIQSANGSYERTTAYVSANSNTLKKLNQLKANSTQRGFLEYNLTTSGNYTVVRIAAKDLLKVVNEDIS